MPTTDRNWPRAASLTLREVLGQLVGVEERGDRHRFLGFLVDHHRHADAAVRMAAAGQVAPLRARPVHEIGPVGERAHERDREPVADRLADPGLVLHVVRQVRQRVALRRAPLVVTSSSRPVNDTGWNDRKLIFFGLSSANWMMRPTCSLLTPLTIVTTGTMSTPALQQVLDRAQLDVEQVADQAVRVGGVADAVELQVGVAQARPRRRALANSGLLANSMPLVAACTQL